MANDVKAKMTICFYNGVEIIVTLKKLWMMC